MERITTVPVGKLRCVVTGKLRPETPEEHVRQRMARSLIEEYGYAKGDLGIEIVVPVGRAKKRADIVIYRAGKRHSIENIFAIVEAKNEFIKPTNADSGIEQLKSYLSASPNSQYGLWVGSEVLAVQKVIDDGHIVFEDCGDLPMEGRDARSPIAFDALVPATDVLKDVFKRCHNYVAANQGGSKEFAFHEFLKITFCKVFDERNSEEPQFFINPSKWKNSKEQKALFGRLSDLFAEVCDEYGYIFGEDEKIKLNPSVCAYLVKELQKYTLLETDFDYKGKAYEEIVGTNSRGDRGEFFTPRNLCGLAIGMLRVVVGDERFSKIKIIDPACGTGGFLRSYIHELYQLLNEKESRKWKNAEKSRKNAKDQLKSICDRNVFGIDFNPVLVRAAQMNLVMHGDGSSNVFHENSLLGHGEWSEETRTSIRDGGFDVVITNPPFGEDLSIDDRHVLEQYTIHQSARGVGANQCPPQILFFERCWKLLKADGLLLIVSPDNVLSNPSYKNVRAWIIRHYEVVASISLPGEMFQPNTGTQTSLLLLKKYKRPFVSLDDLRPVLSGQRVFVSIPKKVGHDQRGNMLVARDEVGDVLVQEVKSKKIVRDTEGSWIEEDYVYTEVVPDDQLPRVLADFNDWYRPER